MRTLVVIVAGILLGLGIRELRGAEQLVQIRVVGNYPCQEDEVLEGVGGYQGEVGWSAYSCVNREEI